ncbi:RNA polymerase sigma factor [Pleionea sp. CnH1-48]|uniref:RNA polymerase sigma factor n=1 Tax=Pleionea sp. CnH1-48 TaxID=2954494 RepID=UPI0020982FF0|nr:sigma-70 family RNA polymerase sigma factor [Pleionea sp. CnH1-48]MCO7227027.1 sigma-70 family RNA polymerase sigma factor [Pleionea sp. CnH1-48]
MNPVETAANKKSSDERQRALIERAQNGDSAALNILFDTHYRKLFNFVRGHVSRLEDVEDLVQDTLIQAQRSIGNFEARSSFSTWLTSIAINLTRNYYNRSPEYKYSFVDDETLGHAASSERPDENLSTDQNMEQLSKAIEELPYDLRQALLMVSVENKSYDEVAEELDISVSSLKSKLFRVRKRLKEQLGGVEALLE